ncbi:MAG: hypothetical protein ACRDPR_09110 [Nocardioidaceae bacterium]
MNDTQVTRPTAAAPLARAWGALRHMTAVVGLLILAFLVLRMTADNGTWYTPQEPGGDPDGYLLAVLGAMTVVAPLTVVAYVAGVIVARMKSSG